jgi:Pyruvate/2-oxoacid:ferredoxin oxidoreductase delta subunit
MIRKIIQIDEEKCNGCGLCVPSCAEGAIEIIDGKARLVKDQYCDGLGACLGECPQDALHIVEREAEEFDEEAAMEHVRKTHAAKSPVNNNQAARHEHGLHSHSGHGHGHTHGGGGCPGSRMRILNQEAPIPEAAGSGDISFSLKSQLQQWPVQLTLVPIRAAYFENADLLITADCVPFAYPDYHPKLLKGKKVVVGCPKLDDLDAYIEKLTAIVEANNLNSITVAFMEVPCCSGMVYAAEQAVRASGKDLKVNKIRITLDGQRQNL